MGATERRQLGTERGQGEQRGDKGVTRGRDCEGREAKAAWDAVA